MAKWRVGGKRGGADFLRPCCHVFFFSVFVLILLRVPAFPTRYSSVAGPALCSSIVVLRLSWPLFEPARLQTRISALRLVAGPGKTMLWQEGDLQWTLVRWQYFRGRGGWVSITAQLPLNLKQRSKQRNASHNPSHPSPCPSKQEHERRNGCVCTHARSPSTHGRQGSSFSPAVR